MMYTYNALRKKLDPDNIIVEQKAEIERLRAALEQALENIAKKVPRQNIAGVIYKKERK